MSFEITKRDLDHYLYEIAKEYKKESGHNAPHAEIVLVGGASIIINYSFREETRDLDAYIRADGNIKDIINRVGDRNELAPGWINDDFTKTSSFSPKIVQYSRFYKTFCNIVDVRTVSDEYLLAMKMEAARTYKHDMSDIIGIIKEMKERGKEPDLEKIKQAYENLYDKEPETQIMGYIRFTITNRDVEELFYETIERERQNKELLLKAQEKYPDRVTAKHEKVSIERFLKEANSEAKGFKQRENISPKHDERERSPEERVSPKRGEKESDMEEKEEYERER